MITEETIKQTRFYCGLNEERYFIADVRSVRIVTLINCTDGKEFDLLLGDDICSQFVPAEASFKALIENEVAAPMPTEMSLKGNKKPRRARGGKATSSQFKGVMKSKKGYADGRDRFETTYYDPVNKKLVYLGSFDNEYLAAAKYQERAGNKAEAKKLYEMAEQANNNPERPAVSRTKKTGKTIWVCKRCGIEWETKPKHCIHCQCVDFREVEKEGGEI